MPMEEFDVKKQEAYDFKLLQKLNDDIFHLENLERREGNSDKDPIDASGITFDGRTINIEIKSRDDLYPAMMCETHKAYSLLDEWIIYNRVPLYVNFLNNGDDAFVWNLLTIPPNMKYLKIERAYSKLYKRYENQYKVYFDLKAAKHYIMNNEGIYKLTKKGS